MADADVVAGSYDLDQGGVDHRGAPDPKRAAAHLEYTDQLEHADVDPISGTREPVIARNL